MRWCVRWCLRVGLSWALVVHPAHAADVAPPPDSMAARTLACVACHGREGRAAPDGYYPRIAGKPDGYLYQQLLNFRDGRRSYPAMAHLLQQLSDDYLREIAGYFSALDLPYAQPGAPQAPAALLAHGLALVRQGDAARAIPACVQCHGERLTGAGRFIPGLLGLPRDYLAAQLGAWQQGQRRARAPDCMARIAARLTMRDVSALAAWLASQRLPADPGAAPALVGPLPLACGAVRPQAH